MKKVKLNSKLNLKKEQIASLNNVKGGVGRDTDECHDSYGCSYWSDCTRCTVPKVTCYCETWPTNCTDLNDCIY